MNIALQCSTAMQETTREINHAENPKVYKPTPKKAGPDHDHRPTVPLPKRKNKQVISYPPAETDCDEDDNEDGDEDDEDTSDPTLTIKYWKDHYDKTTTGRFIDEFRDQLKLYAMTHKSIDFRATELQMDLTELVEHSIQIYEKKNKTKLPYGA